MAVNRLRWQVAANPFTLPDKTNIGLSISIAFSRIGGRIGDRSVLDNCDDALDEARRRRQSERGQCTDRRRAE